jgi:hypothetical protein
MNNYIFVAFIRYIFHGNIASKIDLKELEYYNFPKVCFYGNYKFMFKGIGNDDFLNYLFNLIP